MTLYAKETNLLYHGTRVAFDVFRPLSHFGSLDAAEQILMFPAKEREIVTARHEARAGLLHTQMMPQLFHTATSERFKRRLIEVRLRMSNPLKTVDWESHRFESYRHFTANFILGREMNAAWVGRYPILNRFYILWYLRFLEDGKTGDISRSEACRMAYMPPAFDFIFKDPFMRPLSAVQEELGREKLYMPADKAGDGAERTDRYHLCLQRMIRFFESCGYDGLKYPNLFEDKASFSYVIFRPSQVIRLDGKGYFPAVCRPDAADEAFLNDIYLSYAATHTPRRLTRRERETECGLERLMACCIAERKALYRDM